MTPRHRRRSYHHGNLRDALIDAALELIAERGLASVTLAELARAAGVSAAAPYRHFQDLSALFTEIARQGFERLSSDLATAWDGGRPNPIAAIESCGRAYLAFARAEPGFYPVMFDPSSPVVQQPALKEASARAFAVLKQAAEAAVATIAQKNRPPATMMALHIWALSHGVAALFVGRDEAAPFLLPMPAEDLLEAGLLIYLQSLGFSSER